MERIKSILNVNSHLSVYKIGQKNICRNKKIIIKQVIALHGSTEPTLIHYLKETKKNRIEKFKSKYCLK